MNIFDLIPGNSAKLPSMKGLLVGASLLAIGGAVSAQTLVTNNGALVSVTKGATVIVKTGSLHNAAGLISNQGSLTVEQNVVNDDTMSGGGTTGLYRVHDNWVNNDTFIPDSTKVELYGGNEQITGTAVTTFFDLTLTGTGIKTQTLDANVLDTLALNDRELATEKFDMHILNTDPGVVTKTAGNAGFVSSLDTGRLAWDLDRNAAYLFPTGSSVGVARYRPVQIRPNLNTPQTILIRLANNDATVDGFDRARKDSDLCRINDKFYHLVERSVGTDPVQVSLFYDSLADGLWYVLANWQTTDWVDVGNTIPGYQAPFSILTKANWNGFANQPFALARPNPKIDAASTLVSNLRCYRDGTGAVDVTLSNGTPPLTYSWSNNTSNIDLTGVNAGSYTLTISDQAQCSRSFGPFVITEPAQILLADTSTATIKCNGDQTGAFAVTVTNGVPPIASYQFSPQSGTGNSLNNVGAGTYTVVVTDANGCKDTLTKTITEPSAISISSNLGEVKCFGDSSGSVTLTVTGGTPGTPAYTYQWSDTSVASQPNLNNVAAGTYTVTVTDGNLCRSIDSFTVVQPANALTLMASADTTIAIGYAADLEVLSTNGGTGNVSYSWTPTDNLTNPTGSVTEARPVNTTTYTVVGTDANGCKTSDTVRVRVDSNLVTVPDGFIPDGNNAANHTFHLLTSPTVSVVELKVFNRWGQLISNDVNGWDGTFNGKPQPMDTYVYQATIRLPNGSNMQKSGDFILIR